jgi:GAF domain-containing protein
VAEVPAAKDDEQSLFEENLAGASDVDPDDVSKVAVLLSYHEYRVDVGALFEVTPDPPGTLLAVAADPNQPTSVRLRAFDTLAFVADERVRALYERAIGLRTAGKYRHHAIVGLARAWPAAAILKIGPLLAIEDDAQIRVTAASALVSFCGPDGKSLVAEAASVEPELWVREKMTELAGDRIEETPDETP